MALVKILDKYDMQKEFKAFDRDNFSLDGYQALLDLFEECDCGKNTDLDVIAICCEFTESTIEDIYDDYSNIERIADTKDDDGEIDEDDFLDALNYYTYAVRLDNGNILYQDF